MSKANRKTSLTIPGKKHTLWSVLLKGYEFSGNCNICN